ncbi:MAG TPA: delta-lactam-biosynthetic de-N-acetylase [Clostridiaceae bacterium]|nr:delta-lactam-biosynthetic de-N-acetylase [Clostridiaceae bacterium]
MKKKAIALLLVAILSIMTIMCSGCSKKDDLLLLSDLGGVYAWDFDDLDLSIEVSGSLTEGVAASISTEDDMADTPVDTKGVYSNKLMRWGIRRKPGNQTPDADPGAPELIAKYGGIYIGDTSQKVIYLTFDEGYENGYTPKILDVLRDNNVKAVFFITGPYLKEHQDLVRRMVEEGHTVGNHTIHHPSLPEVSDEQLEEEILGLERAFKEKFGKEMKFLRPPKGEYSERTLAITQKLGYTNLFWSFAYDDWYRDKIRGADYAYQMVMRNLHNGAILLLHAVSKDNADALDMIIKGAREMGYTFGDINDLISN